MSRRKDHSREELKNLILEAAIYTITQEDGEGLTARKIATHIGYAPGTIYNIFPSMEDVILHVNAQTLDLLLETLNHPSCRAKHKSALQNMKVMAYRYMDFARDNSPLWAMLFAHSLSHERYENLWYKNKIDSLFNPLQSVLSDFNRSLSIPECQRHARILWSSVHGVVYLNVTGKFPGNPSDPIIKKLLDTLVATYARGISPSV